jgi:hypothetical protein
VLAALSASACGSTPQRPHGSGTAPAEPPATELGPGLRASIEGGWVEFDATVPIDTRNPSSPDVYLELIACSPDTREHESLVVTDVRPSGIHAALLILGLKPGTPGRVEMTEEGVVRTPASGDEVEIQLRWTEAGKHERVDRPSDWYRDDGSGSGPRSVPPAWVFTGSREVQFRGRAFYDADGTGVVIGLTTFGSEVIGLRSVISPDSATDEPRFLARNDAVPPVGTPVRVRLVRLVRAD